MLYKQTTSIKGLRAKNLPPPIPLFEDSEEQAPPKKGNFIKLDLHTVPGEAESDTYQLEVRFFNSGSPRQWVEFVKTFRKVVAGQGLNTGPSKCNMTRTLLKGDALRAFNKAATTRGNDANPNFTACLDDVTACVFPRQAPQKQKRCFRRQLRKPKEFTMRQTVTPLRESNHDLRFFPNGNENSSLAEEELCEIVEWIIPNTWQRQLLIQGFDITTHTLTELVEKLEQLETAESIYEEVHGKGQNANAEQQASKKSDGSKGNAKSSSRGSGNKPNGKRSRSSTLPRELWCPYHDQPHTMQDCKVIGAQVQAMKNQRDAQFPASKKPRFSNKTWKRKPDPEGETHAMLPKSRKTGKKSSKKASKKKVAFQETGSSSEEEWDEEKLSYVMEKSSISSSDDE